MRVATILPVAHLWLEDGAGYHLCLAHQIANSLTYTFFFMKQAREDGYVILDNGAAERGVPMSVGSLLRSAKMIGCQEMVLPDTINDQETTLRDSYNALRRIRESLDINVMAVPHGRSVREWTSCALEMLLWDIDAMGISKFIVPTIFPSRVEALETISEAVDSRNHKRRVDLHLLGSTGIRGEVARVEQHFPGKVRGIDSGIPTLYTQLGEEMKDGRPDVGLDLNASLDEELLRRNINMWRMSCSIS